MRHQRSICESTDSKNVYTKLSFPEDLKWVVPQFGIYHMNTLQYYEILMKNRHRKYIQTNQNVNKTNKLCNIKNCINVQCPHTATPTNTSFQVFVAGINHLFPFTHCYSGIKLWPCECGWGLLKLEACAENIKIS